MSEDGNEGLKREGSHYPIGRVNKLANRLEGRHRGRGCLLSSIEAQGAAVGKRGPPSARAAQTPRAATPPRASAPAERPVSHPKRPWAWAAAARGRACGRSKRHGFAERLRRGSDPLQTQTDGSCRRRAARSPGVSGGGRQLGDARRPRRQAGGDGAARPPNGGGEGGEGRGGGRPAGPAASYRSGCWPPPAPAASPRCTARAPPASPAPGLRLGGPAGSDRARRPLAPDPALTLTAPPDP